MPGWNSFESFLVDVRAAEQEQRQPLVQQLFRERQQFPWVEGNLATFVFNADRLHESVNLNIDIFRGDPPFRPLQKLTDTSLWYIQQEFPADALLDYMFAVDDPQTPLRNDDNLLERIANHWRPDTLNRYLVRNGNTQVSILRMPKARPTPDWQQMTVPRGLIFEHSFSSAQMNFQDRTLWVYTPPGYEQTDIEYPLLILFDGQWMIDTLQIPYIADALIKHNKMQPILIAMLESGSQQQRIQDYVENDKNYTTILTELLPFMQIHYRIDATNLGLGGISEGAIAAAHATLKNPAVFSHLVMISPSFGSKVQDYAARFDKASILPRRIFQSVGRYETPIRFHRPGIALASILERRQNQLNDIDFQFAELGSGHSFAAFKAILPEGLAHIFPAQTS